MNVYPTLELSRTGEDEADILWEGPEHSLALGGVTYEFAERIVACANACKDISTEHLTQFPNWKLAVATMARPGDVCNLILSRDKYMKALQNIADMTVASSDDDKIELVEALNSAIWQATEALK